MRGWWKRLQPAGQREAAVGACLAHAALRVSNFTLDGLRPARVHPGRTDGRRAFFLFFKQREERLNQSKALLSFFFFQICVLSTAPPAVEAGSHVGMDSSQANLFAWFRLVPPPVFLLHHFPLSNADVLLPSPQ